MNQSKSHDWKTPLGVYERAIREIVKTREEIQAHLSKMQAAFDSSQREVNALKEELQSTKDRLAIAEKKADDVLKEIGSWKAEIKEKSQTLRIEQGVWEGTAKNTPGWSILEGEGRRVVRIYITFSENFSEPPKVVVGLSYFDMIRKSNSRLKVKVSEIDTKGFYVQIQTYWDSQVWAAGVNWIAYGY